MIFKKGGQGGGGFQPNSLNDEFVLFYLSYQSDFSIIINEIILNLLDVFKPTAKHPLREVYCSQLVHHGMLNQLILTNQQLFELSLFDHCTY